MCFKALWALWRSSTWRSSATCWWRCSYIVVGVAWPSLSLEGFEVVVRVAPFSVWRAGLPLWFGVLVSSDSQSASKSAALEILQRGVSDLLTSAGWRRALEFRRQFYQYSSSNSSLILAQKPDAQLVAGFKKWRASDRHLRKGEKGIAILAPVLVPHPEEQDQKLLVGFRSDYVFDVSQSDGKPLLVPMAPLMLQDSPEDRAKVAGLGPRLSAFCGGCGVTISWDFKHPTALGAYQPGATSIGIRGTTRQSPKSSSL